MNHAVKSKLSRSIVLLMVVVFVIFLVRELNLFSATNLSTRINEGSSASQSDRTENAELKHDFGVIAPGTDVFHKFKLENNSKEKWTILEIEKPSCACTLVGIDQQEIPPGSASVLEFKYRSPSTVADISQSVKVRVKSITTFDVLLTIKANIRKPLTVLPSAFDLGAVAAGDLVRKPILIENYSASRWENVRIAGSDAIVKLVGMSPISADAGLATAAYQAELEIDTKTCKPKVYNYLLTAKAVGGVGETEIPITFSVVDGLVISPSVVSFGNVKKGDIASAKIRLLVNGELAHRFNPEFVVIKAKPYISSAWKKNGDASWILSLSLNTAGLGAGIHFDKINLTFSGEGIKERELEYSVDVN